MSEIGTKTKERGPRWRRRKEARPAEILDAALSTFTAKGFAGTRLDDVAALAGISKGTLYLYFADKTGLFEAVVHERLRGRILAAIDTDEDLPSLAALQLVLGRLARLIADPRLSAIPKLIISESGNFPDLAKFYMREVIKPVRDRLAALIAKGIARGELMPVKPDIVAKLIIAPVLLAALWRHTFAPFDSLRLDPAELLAEHLGILERGLSSAQTRLP